MVLQANIFLLLFGAIQGLLLSIALLSKRERHHSHVFLTLFLVVVGLQLTFKVISKLWLMDNTGWVYEISYDLPFLAAPAIYLFIRTRMQNTGFKKWDWLHAMPFVVKSVLGVLGYLEFEGAFYWLNMSWVRGSWQMISLGIYFWMSWRMIDSTKTLRQFLIYVTSAEAIVIITLALMVRYYGVFPDVRLLFVLLTVVIYWITWKMMSDPSALIPNSVVTVSMEPKQVSRYAHSGLKVEEAIRIESDLRSLMMTKKVFTDTSLTIDKLSAQLGTSRHHLSQVLNERIHKQYGEYITDLRLEEARIRLSDPKSNRYTIAAMAMDSGFNAISTFNEAFKRKYNVTPSVFRAMSLRQQSA